MKILILTMILSLVGCNGGGIDGLAPEIGGSIETVNSVQYESFGFYSTFNDGGSIKERSLGAPILSDEFKVPTSIAVNEDQNWSLRVGDTAYIMLNNYFENKCQYIYDGVSFVFDECQDDLGGVQVGDIVESIDYPHPSTGNNREITIVLYGRVLGDLHTGNIRLEALL